MRVINVYKHFRNQAISGGLSMGVQDPCRVAIGRDAGALQLRSTWCLWGPGEGPEEAEGDGAQVPWQLVVGATQ